MAEKRQRPPMGHGPGPMMGKKEKPHNIKKVLKRVIKYISSQKFIFISLLIVVIFYTVSNLYSNVLIKDVIGSLGSYNSDTNTFESDPDSTEFYYYLVVLGIVYVVYCIFQYFASLLGAYLANKTVRKMREDLFDKLVHLPISYIDTHAHGDLMSRMTNDVDNISLAISESITSLLSGILTVIGCLFIMIYYSPLLTLVAVVVLFLSLFLSKIVSKKMGPLFSKQQAYLGELNSETEEIVTSYKTVMAFNQEEESIKKFNEKSDNLANYGSKAQMIGSCMGPIMNFIGNIGYFAVCVLGSLFIVWGIGGSITGSSLTIAVVVMFLSTTKQFTRPITQIAQLYSSLITALAGAERVFEIMDCDSEKFETSENINLKDIKGNIEFSHLNFSYDNKHIVLKDFSATVKSGEKIALVGATGSGKTTIVNLLLRFYDLNLGKITIDGYDISKMNKKDLRSFISIVLQEPILFQDTIENNIKYAKSDASEKEIDAALDFADCNQFINKLPMGKKTILSEGAGNISQGERQLLTIARAVLANPKILVLDEATSSVDTRTEKRIQDSMVRLMKDRTSIIIAHRLSTIQDADLIIVLDNGVVKEMGNHNELLEKKGKYYDLYQTQYKGIEI